MDFQILIRLFRRIDPIVGTRIIEMDLSVGISYEPRTIADLSLMSDSLAFPHLDNSSLGFLASTLFLSPFLNHASIDILASLTVSHELENRFDTLLHSWLVIRSITSIRWSKSRKPKVVRHVDRSTLISGTPDLVASRFVP